MNPTKAETVRYTDTTELEAKFGPLTIGGRGSSSEGRYLKTKNLATGTTTYTTNVRYNNSSFTLSNDEDANGNPVGTPRYSLMLHDVDPSYWPLLYDRMGQKPPSGDPPEDLRIDFTEAELRQLQDLALNRIAERIGMGRDGRLSIEEIREGMDNGTIEWDGATYAFTGLESGLAWPRTRPRCDRALPRWLHEPEPGDRGSRVAHGRPDARMAGDDQPAVVLVDRRQVDSPARRVHLLHHHPHRVAEPDPRHPGRRSASSRAR